MEAMPDDALEQAVRELSARLERLIGELQATRTACLELGKALDARRSTKGAGGPGGGSRKSRPLEPAELEVLAQALRTESAEQLQRKLSGYTKAQLQQVAAHLGSGLAKGKRPKDELVSLLIAEARYHDEHRRLRGF